MRVVLFGVHFPSTEEDLSGQSGQNRNVSTCSFGCHPISKNRNPKPSRRPLRQGLWEGKEESISERRGNNIKWFTDFYLTAKARIWP